MVAHTISAELRLTLCELREQRLRSFSRKTSDASVQRLCLLRKMMDEQNLDGFLLPRADEYQSEYLPRSSQRLAWLTGFDGSAGFAIVLMRCAAIFTDGRYTLQIRDQVNEKYFEIYNTAEMLPLEWLKTNLVQNERIGFDPWLHTCDEVTKINSVLASKNATAIKLPKNLIDQIWIDRHLQECSVFLFHQVDFPLSLKIFLMLALTSLFPSVSYSFLAFSNLLIYISILLCNSSATF